LASSSPSSGPHGQVRIPTLPFVGHAFVRPHGQSAKSSESERLFHDVTEAVPGVYVVARQPDYK
ncbi:hypothetical protein E4U54_008048, partial [Claviceps lovelessii]